MDTKEQILTKAVEFFIRYGFRSVTMDDLCRELGISKKTLYQYFPNKDALIEESIMHHGKDEAVACNRIFEQSRDAVEEFLLISRMNRDILREISPVAIYDLQKYHPDIWRRMMLEQFTEEYGMISRILEDGKKQGLFRADLPVDTVVRLFMAQLSGMVQEHIFPSESNALVDAIPVRDELFLRAICTPEGLQKRDQYESEGLPEVNPPTLGGYN